jgi:hypothetical protein
MKRREINEMVTFHDTARLAALTPAEVGEYLVSELSDDVADPGADVERLIGLGITFAGAGHQDAAAAVLHWLAAAPAARRLDLAALLLHGLWMSAAHEGSLDGAKVAILLDVRAGLRLDETVEYDYVLLLCLVATPTLPQPVRERVAGELRGLLQRGFTDREYDRLARERMRGALSRI